MRRAAVTLSLLMLVALLVPSVDATVNYGGYGTHPKLGDGDFVMQLQDLPATQIPFLAVDDANTPGVDTDDSFFIHFDGPTSGTDRKFNDIRLHVGSGQTGSPGDLLTSSVGTYDSIVDLDGFDGPGEPLDDVALFIRYLEMDGKPGFSDKDWLYIDADASGDLSLGDVRLSTPSTSGTSASGVSVTASDRYVDVTDSDYTAAKSTTEDKLPHDPDGSGDAKFETLGFQIKFFDANVNGIFDSGDTLVAVADDAPSDDYVGLGMVFLSKAGSRTHGAHVPASLSGTVPLLHALASTDAYLVSTSDPGATPNVYERDLYIHFGSPDGAPDCSGAMGYIQYGDIILRKDATGTSGAAKSFMVRVVSEATGAGAAIKACTPFAATLFYINDPGTPTGFTSTDPIYINLPATAFGGDSDTLALSVNDLRFTRNTISGTTFNAGTTVRTGNADLTSFSGATEPVGSATPAWHILHRDVDQSRGIPLKALANAKFHDANGDDLWDPATEAVYISSDTTVNTGDIRIHAGGSGGDESSTDSFAFVDCNGASPAEDAGCTDTIEANTAIKVTGPDTTWDKDQGEFVVWSPDLWATPVHDRAITPIGGLARGAPLTDDEALTYAWTSTGDSFYLQWDEAAVPNGALPILKVHDVKFASTPTFVSGTSSEHVPTLHRLVLPGGHFTEYDLGGSNPAGNAYYVRLASAAGGNLAVNDLRASPAAFVNKATGTLLTSSDSQELGAATSRLSDSGDSFESHVFYIDDGPPGLDPTDPVYVDLPGDIGGNADGVFSSFDVRINGASIGGETYGPGTMVRTGNTDLTSYPGFEAWGLGEGYYTFFFDENRDGSFNGDDMLYLVYLDTAPGVTDTLVPDLLSLRMIGAGGASSGGGGSPPTGTTAPPATSTTAPPATTTTTPTETATDTGTGTGGTGGTNGTGGTGGGDNQTPGLGLVAVLGLLAAALLVVRRRL